MCLMTGHVTVEFRFDLLDGSLQQALHVSVPVLGAFIGSQFDWFPSGAKKRLRWRWWRFTFPSWDPPNFSIRWEAHRKRITAVSPTS
jgi:hypothetical protein